ncbi:MAG: hypothetical protein ACEPOV_02025 [Hyphomicrobiales bacterium]
MKELKFKKETIANLETIETNQVFGGGTHQECGSYSCTPYCAVPFPTTTKTIYDITRPKTTMEKC